MQLPSNSHLPQCLGKLTVQHKEVSQPWAKFIQFQCADSLTVYITFFTGISWLCWYFWRSRPKRESLALVEWSQKVWSILQVLHWFTASSSSECKWFFACLSYWNCSIKGAWGYHDQPIWIDSPILFHQSLPILNLSVDELTSWILPDVSDLRQCQMNSAWTVPALSRIVVRVTYLLYSKCLEKNNADSTTCKTTTKTRKYENTRTIHKTSWLMHSTLRKTSLYWVVW